MEIKNSRIKQRSRNNTGQSAVTDGNYGWLIWVILVIVLIISSVASVLFLRMNNQNMVRYRDNLVAADKTGDAKQVQRAAKLLQNYVAGHMNTATGKIALQTLYNQAAEKALEASKPIEVSTDVYQAATEACKPELTNRGYRAWADCVANKVGSTGAYSLDANKQAAPDPDIYYIEYAPARWSIDLAGISLMIAASSLALLCLGVVVKLIIRLVDYLRNHQFKVV